MHFTSSLVALLSAVPLLVSGAPVIGKRAASDILVFKFADVLEQLESEFYKQALAKFTDSDFAAAGFPSSQVPIQQFEVIQADEATHSTVLQAALKSFGETPITSCKFNFAGALTDVATMAATARVVEAVGVGAYLGGSTLLTDPVLLTSAASILTAEARHQTVLNILSLTGSAIFSPFDLPLTPGEVLALAGPFFDGACDLGIPANPALALTNTGTVAPGTKLSFSAAAINSTTDTSKLFCQMLVPGQPASIALPFNECVVPNGINGVVAVYVTSDGQPLINNVRDRATTQLVAGPIMAFIDTAPEMLGQLARLNIAAAGGSNAPVASSTSTRTITPSEASAIISSATPAATPASSEAGASSGSTPAAAAANVPSTANTSTGPSADGSIVVNGWSNV